MRILLLVISITVLFSCKNGNSAATITSGDYSELKLAFNPQKNLITGYYENGTGTNSEGTPQFSCIFYVEGKMIENEAIIKTYYPTDDLTISNDDIIVGKFDKIDKDKISIQLNDEHGGCFGVQPFREDPVQFTLDKKQNWIEIRYIIASKAYFYTKSEESAKWNLYLIKGDVICIDKIEGKWLHCTYFGKNDHNTQGWIKSENVNFIK